MHDLAGTWGRWMLFGNNRWSRDGRLIELAALAIVLAAAFSLVLPIGLAAWPGAGDDHSVNRLLNACQQGVRRGPFAVVGYSAAAVLIAWSVFVVARLAILGARDLRNIVRKGRILAAQSEDVECCAGGRPLGIRVLGIDERLAFTAGLARPRVYVSRGLLRDLSPRELEAALLHEVAHAERRDPLRCWLIELVMLSLWFPRFSRLGDAYRAARESRADIQAIVRLGDDRALLQALHKVDALAPTPGSCGLTSEREQALRRLRADGLSPVGGEGLGLVVGLGVIAVLMVITVVGFTDWQSYWFCPDGGGVRT